MASERLVPYENLSDEDKERVKRLSEELDLANTFKYMSIPPNIMLLAIERWAAGFRAIGEELDMEERGENN